MPRAPIVFNGRFLSARPTGVQRVAGELITHIDRLISRDQGRDRRWSLLCPKNSHQPLPLKTIERRSAGLLTGQAWEQLELPRLAGDALLVNLCNMAPLVHRDGVTMIHDAQVFLSPESYSPAFRAWYRFALPRVGAAAARVVTVSNYSRDRLAAFGVAAAEKISVVHNGADHFSRVTAELGVISRLRLAPGGFVVATAGAQKHKNLGVLFEAFRSDALSDLVLVVVGGDDADAFRAAGFEPSPKAVFAGRISDGEVRALYEHAACLAFPSTTEGFGLPPLEAMSLGCPTIAAPCGALPEVCGDAVLYAQPDNPATWVQAIRRAVDDGETRTRLQSAGPARSALYRWEASALKLLNILESVADRPTDPAR